MNRTDQRTHQQISDIVEACAGYWELRGIARASSHEMQLELELHLQQAVSDGKSLEAVLGPNPVAFAEAWAREMHPRFWRGGAVVLHGLVYALSVVSTTALLSHLLVHSSVFIFTLFEASLLTGSGLLALLLQLGGFLAPRVSTRAGRQTLVLAGVVLAVLVLRLAGLQVHWSVALLSWGWPITIALLVLTAFLISLACWCSSDNKHLFTDSESLPVLRAVTTFVASIGIFDVMLFGGSVAVFDFCKLAMWLV